MDDRRRAGVVGGRAEHLAGVRHRPLLTPAMVRALTRVDRRSLDAGLVGYRQA
jgi:hypothetical protein